MRRVGFVVENYVGPFASLRPGRVYAGAIGSMRCRWLADSVNARYADVRYELYRPWRRYDVVVFLKSMNPTSRALRRNLADRGVRTIFDCNVNYFEREGTFFYDGMAPTPEQIEAAIEMVSGCDGTIADSSLIAERCSPHSRRVAHIPDNIPAGLVPSLQPWTPGEGRLRLLWSGQALKAFELLAIEDVLGEFGDRVELVLVTNDWGATARWHDGLRERIDSLWQRVPHTILPFTGIPDLLRLYAEGGVAISPRFLDNSYNLGHTEWKITLPMSCGRLVLCSPQQSYCEVADLCGDKGIRVCRDNEAWRAAFDEVLSGSVDWPGEGQAAQSGVLSQYETDVVADRHLAFVHEVLDGGQP